ncbi:SusC/RagA family TonB-linked outer membrane protein [Catalinimonas sp. 4WD22]|uniref:SusC/RagA family TonB-linked outer membrane protein n=1 Tax=Catalinimonas locisalis TaxID=3133978 RepID=UPI003100F6F6
MLLKTTKKKRVMLVSLLFMFVLNPLYAQHFASAERSEVQSFQPSQVESKSLQHYLMDLEKEFEIQFAYDSELVKDKKVSLDSDKGQKLEFLLNQALEPNALQYKKIGEKLYVIQQKEQNEIKKINTKSDRREGKTETLALLNSLSISPIGNLAQTIRGKVTDGENGEPLPGVNVLAKGTTIGTVTDISGNYQLTVDDEVSTLVFSSIGYVTEEVSINGQNIINLELLPDIQSLSEVVVVGYGTQQKKDVTGSIASVKLEDVKNMAVASPDALLQGKAAGVQVVQNSGTPGGEVFVRVRGTASLLGETRPLFVIDGVPMNNSTAVSAGGQRNSTLADINPNDIESMEILKDAAATAIYGARGSNGVILITTKRGKEGKARINFDAYTGVQSIWRDFDLLNGSQFVNLLEESLTNRNPDLLNNPPYNELEITGVNSNYQDEVFRTAPISNYSLSVSGGNEKMQSYVSLGYFNQQGTIIGQEFERFSARLNLDYQATDRLKIGTSTTLSNTLQKRVQNDFSGLSVLGNALIRNPNLPVYNTDGTYSVDPLRTENPVQLANEITFEGNQRRLITNFYGEYQILDGLTFRSVLGVDYNDERQNRYIPSFILSRTGIAEARADLLDEQTIVNDNTLNYSKTFGAHNVSVLAGIGFQRSTFNILRTGGQQAGSDIIKTVGAIADPFIPSQDITGWGIMSYFGRANYSFQDKYLIEGSFRVDGSSRFGANRRYGVFPGLSVGWRLSEENFLSEVSAITDLKIRAGIGVTGNQDGIGNFASRALYSVGRNYDGNPGIGQANIPNEDLGWESTTTTNIGIDLALFNGRVSTTAEAYVKTTSDLIFSRNLPWTSGFWSIGNANIGEMENRGLELAFTTRNTTGEFKWTTDFNISFNRVKITDLPENGEAGSDYIFKLPDAYGVEGAYSIYRIGAPVGSFFGYVYDGVFASDTDVPEGLFERGVRGGDANFQDLNEDGVYDRQNDRAIIGNALPQHIGGFTNTFAYKGVELSVLFNWSYGNDMYNMTRAVLTAMSEDYNQSTDVLQRWQQQGDVTDMPKAIYGSSSVSGAAPTDASSRYIEDGSFLRMRNATLAYNFPSELLQRINIASARIYFSGQNLLTFTNYSGLDPENQNQGTGTPSLGVDYLTQPQPRIYMFGINIGI